MVSFKRGRSDVKTLRQVRYINFKEEGLRGGMLQDELAGGVVDADGLDIAVVVDEVEFVGDGVRIDAEWQRFLPAATDVGLVGFVKVRDAVAEIGIRVVVEVAAFADYLHDFR